MTRWIDISKKLPPKRTRVLVTDGKTIGISEVMFTTGGICTQFGMAHIKRKPTHWSLLPSLPKLPKTVADEDAKL